MKGDENAIDAYVSRRFWKRIWRCNSINAQHIHNIPYIRSIFGRNIPRAKRDSSPSSKFGHIEPFSNSFVSRTNFSLPRTRRQQVDAQNNFSCPQAIATSLFQARNRRKFIELRHLIRAVNILNAPKTVRNCLFFSAWDFAVTHKIQQPCFFCAEFKNPQKLQPETVIVSKRCVS